MTDLGSSTSWPMELLPGVSLRPRPRSASEAIRRRVNQRLASTGNSFEPPELLQTSYSAQTSYSKPEPRSPSAPTATNREPHSLKRKTNLKADNRGPETSLEGSSLSQRKGRLFVTKRPHCRHHDAEQVDESSDDGPTFTDPIAATEVDSLRVEVDSLKQALHESKKIIKRQAKKYDEARAELSSTIRTSNDKESELTSLKERYTKREELVSTIESSVQCQICMDLPDSPFALAPCGHILCLACLQEWFRKAPPALDDMDIDPEEMADSRYVLMRSKSCPTCRAVVKHRPVPVFMVRAIVGALRKAKSLDPPLMPQNRDSESGREPWKGIFPSSEDDDDGETEDGDPSTEESESEFDFQVGVRTPHYLRRRAVRRAMFRAMYNSTISDEDEEAEGSTESDDDGLANNSYVRARWTPPSVDVDLAAFDISEEQDPVGTFKLLQRGCTWEMIQNYDLSYDHSSGIVLSLRSLNHLYASDDEEGGPEPEDMNRIFLGWNITLDDIDVDGEAFVCKVIEDIKRSPFRWEVTPRVGVPGALDARKLLSADEVVDYDTTDTELWMDSDDL